jgi:AbrB family looped-hinge helix DNA binding protein
MRISISGEDEIRKERCAMDMAKVSMKGQVTIPIEIRRKLDLKEGDKVVFMEQGDHVVLLNANRLAWKDLHNE